MSMTRQQRRAAARAREKTKPAGWSDFREIEPEGRVVAGDYARAARILGIPEAEVRTQAEAMYAQQRFFVNDLYEVTMEAAPQKGWLHLIIRKVDGSVGVPWADKQRIKNDLVGVENEAVELFPAESRLVDMSNTFHLWVLDDADDRLPVGFNDGRQVHR